jgi:hypothetical protein
MTSIFARYNIKTKFGSDSRSNGGQEISPEESKHTPYIAANFWEVSFFRTSDGIATFPYLFMTCLTWDKQNTIDSVKKTVRRVDLKTERGRFTVKTYCRSLALRASLI